MAPKLSVHASSPYSYLTRLVHQPGAQMSQMLADRDAVFREYGRLFSPERVATITSADFQSFLLYENNRHWWGIHRQRRKQTADMPRLQHALSVLVDERRPIAERIDWLMGAHGPKPVPGLGFAVMTPILHVVYPDRYGVWNSIAQSAMTRLGLWPDFARGWTDGRKYVSVNAVNLDVSRRLGVDLWTVDTLWWMVEREHEPTRHQFEGSGGSSGPSNPGVGGTRTIRPMFVCEACFRSKPVGLRAPGADGLCADCVG